MSAFSGISKVAWDELLVASTHPSISIFDWIFQ